MPGREGFAYHNVKNIATSPSLLWTIRQVYGIILSRMLEKYETFVSYQVHLEFIQRPFLPLDTANKEEWVLASLWLEAEIDGDEENTNRLLFWILIWA